MRQNVDEIMDRAVRLSIAASIVLGGASVAMLFRSDLAGNRRLLPGPGEQLVLRDRVATRAPPLPRPVEAPADRKATILTPVQSDDQPPALERSYPGTAQRWGTSLSMGLPTNTDPARPIRHRIVDGDTLPMLAERYLGSQNRSLEIFEANRDVLASPDLLPIGAELKIPLRHKPAPATAEPPLVPVQPKH